MLGHCEERSGEVISKLKISLKQLRSFQDDNFMANECCSAELQTECLFIMVNKTLRFSL